MKICLIADHSGKPDEGMRKISLELYQELSKRHQILLVEPRRVFHWDLWRQIGLFSPDILHYVQGPTIRSLSFLKVAKLLFCVGAKTVASATRPYFSIFSRHLIPLLKPDLILTQSLKFEVFFQKSGCKVSFLSNGVDTEKFRPFSKGEKRYLREKYGIPAEKFIVLHVGHIKRNRNLEVLVEIQQLDSIQVIAVGGTSMPMDIEVKNLLEEGDCIVWRRYFENIAEIYGFADCFMFPAQDLEEGKLPRRYNEIGCIDLPLSVLEAMACNLPVLCTRFGALPRLFQAGHGFFYFQDEQELLQKLGLIRQGLNIETREMVKKLDWTQIAVEMEREYRTLGAR